MSHIYEVRFSENQKARFISWIKRKIRVSPSCHVWTGSTNHSGYGIYRPYVEGKQHKVIIHRFYFYLKKDVMDQDGHVSHLCHHKLCVKIEHLSLEPQEVNNSRKTCKFRRRCIGHDGYPQCLFLEGEVT